MNTDIRLSISFWDHPKTVKLERRLGLEGVKSLQILWMWVAANRPSGDLTESNDRSTTVQRRLNEEDIEIAARWNGDENLLVSTLVDLGWMDETGHGFVMHGWGEHNPWASEAGNRSDKARFSRLAKTNPSVYEALKSQGVTSITVEEYNNAINDRSTTVQRTVNASLTPAPAPAPAPAPVVREECDTTPPKKRESKRNGFDFSFSKDEHVKHLQDFVEMRRAIKKPITQKAIELNYKAFLKAAEHFNVHFDEVVDFTIMKTWMSPNIQFMEKQGFGVQQTAKIPTIRCHQCGHEHNHNCINRTDEQRLKCTYFEQAVTA